MRATRYRTPCVLPRAVILLALLILTSDTLLAERLPIKTYTTTDGLANDQVNRIVRDSRGFLWFCTTDGLSRFDGYKFTSYGTDQGLPHRHITDLIESRRGDYWVAAGPYLCRFNPGSWLQSDRTRTTAPEPRFVIYHLGDVTGRYHINSLFEDRAGTVWCGKGDGLYRIDLSDGQWTFSAVSLGLPAVAETNVSSIAEDHNGALWISTGTGLYRHRSDGVVERFSVPNVLPPPHDLRLLVDKEGRIWLGAADGLYLIVSDPQPGRSVVARVYTVKDGLAGNNISSLLESSDGTLWVGTWNALSALLPGARDDAHQFKIYTSANGVGDVVCLGEDRDGNLWVGSESHGATKIAAKGFTTYRETDGLGGARVGQISENRAGELCVIAGALFINRFDGEKFTPVQLTLPKGISQWSWGWYQYMLQDTAGDWWVSTFDGLMRYPKLDKLELLTHARPKAIYTTRDGLSGNGLFRIFEDSRGDIWAGTIDADYGLNRWDRATGVFRRYTREDGIPLSAPTAFCEDPSGNLWIGFYDGKLARYRDCHFTVFSKEDGLPAGLVRALYLDRSGRIWLANSEGGAIRIDDPSADQPRFVRYTTAQGLSSNQTTCVTEDEWGRIYIGSGRGVDRLEPATGRMKHYTVADGLASNSINVSFRDRHGALWFGTLDGLSRLIPERERPEPAPPVLIGGLRIAGTQQVFSELGEESVSGLELAPGQNQLQIDFFGLGFGLGEVLRYQYQLKGVDKDWNALTDLRSVTYATLAPGDYRFLVRAVTTDGLASPAPATVAFTVLPPVWRRWWFLALVATLFGLLAYSLYRYRIAQLLELERVRTRIATDLHDDIGSTLSQIAILSEVARKHLSHSEVPAMTPLSRIAHLSRESVDAMSDIVWAINPHKDRLSDLTNRMRHLANEVLLARDIEVRFHAPAADQDKRIDADTRRQVFLIFKEGINNLVRHSACTAAEIDFRNERASLVLTLRDNGRGFDPEHSQGGHGLTSLHRRAEALRAELQVVSSPGRGTTVTVRIPQSK